MPGMQIHAAGSTLLLLTPPPSGPLPPPGLGLGIAPSWPKGPTWTADPGPPQGSLEELEGRPEEQVPQVCTAPCLPSHLEGGEPRDVQASPQTRSPRRLLTSQLLGARAHKWVPPLPPASMLGTVQPCSPPRCAHPFNLRLGVSNG